MRSIFLLFIFFMYALVSGAQICFDPETDYNAGVNTSSLCRADFNGDGHLDIAAANNAGSVSIFLGDGTGSFGTASDFDAGYLANDICTADFNNDSIPDLATTNLGPWTVTILLGDGTGAFNPGTSFSVNTPHAVASADLNGDGNTDLAVATQFNVQVALGNGAGSFGIPTIFGSGHSYTAITVADFNGDSIADLAMPGSGNMVWVLLGEGTGSFGLPSGFSVGDTPESIVSGDFNGDGKADVATTNRFSNDISILSGDGTGSFATAESIGTSSYPATLTSEDFDGDGNIDLAVACVGTDSVFVFRGDGSGNFTLAGSFGIDSYPNDIVNGDFDSDGRPDLALTTVYSNIDTGIVNVLLSCTATVVTSPLANGKDITFYPNPSGGRFIVELNDLKDDRREIEVYNALGEKLYSTAIPASRSYSDIDLSMYASGVYLVKIRAGGNAFEQKILIQK